MVLRTRTQDRAAGVATPLEPSGLCRMLGISMGKNFVLSPPPSRATDFSHHQSTDPLPTVKRPAGIGELLPGLLLCWLQSGQSKILNTLAPSVGVSGL